MKAFWFAVSVWLGILVMMWIVLAFASGFPGAALAGPVIAVGSVGYGIYGLGKRQASQEKQMAVQKDEVQP